MPPTDVISQLREQLETLRGPARSGPLVRLGQALADRYWRLGPGLPDALPSLNEAIEAIGEGYRYLGTGDALRGQVGLNLGYLTAARHTAHGGGEQDRERGIELLEESLTAPDIPPIAAAAGRISLGALYLSRVTQSMKSTEFAMSPISTGTGPASLADAERAIACFRQILTADLVSDEINAAAQAMLATAEAMRRMLSSLGGGIAGLDLNGMIEAMTELQKTKDRFGGTAAGPGGPAGGGVPFLRILHDDPLAFMDPLDRPVAVAYGPEPPDTAAPRARQPAATVSIDRDGLRSELHDRLSAMMNVDGGVREDWVSAVALLLPGRPLPESEAVDASVALATIVADGAPATDPVIAGADRFLLAVSLFLRDRLDSEGQVRSGDSGDRLAGAQSLLAAAQAIPPEHPAAVPVFTAVGAFLDDRRPLDVVLDAVAGGFVERADALLATGAMVGRDVATVRGLRRICQAATDIRSGALREPTTLESEVDAVPVEYPWRFRLRAAVRQAAQAV